MEKENNKLTNKQKFWLSFTLIIILGIFINSLVLGLAWVNSPTYWSTNHYFDFNGNEYIASSLNSIRDISVNSKDINYGEQINCTGMIYYFNQETGQFEETNTYQFIPNCYAVKGEEKSISSN